MDEKDKKVMVAIDESECSHYALEWTLENLSDTIKQSRLVIFTVQSFIHRNFPVASSYISAHPELLASIEKRNKKIALALLDKAKEICALRGIEAEIITESGDPKQQICEAVKKYDIRLLVLGSHGWGTIKRAFLGSVSSYCSHNATCPVLVVKKPD